MKEFKVGDLLFSRRSAQYPRYCVVTDIVKSSGDPFYKVRVFSASNEPQSSWSTWLIEEDINNVVPKDSLEYVLNYPDLTVEAEEIVK